MIASGFSASNFLTVDESFLTTLQSCFKNLTAW